MIRVFRKKLAIIALFLLSAILVSGCNESLSQAAQALDTVAGSIEEAKQTVEEASKDEASKEDAPKDDTATATAITDEKSSAKDEEAPKLPTSDIYIIYTSDVHCGVDMGFGYASVKQIREKLEAEGAATILVDDGDFVQGEPIGTLSKGEAIIPIMNALKYDIAVPGNHEFDYGMDEFMKYTKLADFPIICCNFTKDDKPVFEPYIIKEVAGMKIAFVGVTTPETLTSVSPNTFMDENDKYIYGFMQGDNGSKLYAAVQSAIDSAKAEGADLVYILGHMGNDPASSPYSYMDVIANTTGIDVFLDGHSHDLNQDVAKDKDGKDVPRSACGTKLNAIGYSHIKAEDGSIDTNIWTWENTISAPDLLGIKNDISDLIDKEDEKMEEQLKKVVAKTDVDLTINDPDVLNEKGMPQRRVRSGETNMGDLCADAVRIRTGADIGFVNGGGVRADINKGDVTYEDIISVHPFGNKTVVIEATGQQIADALEWSCHDLPNEDGGFLQVSGLTFKVDATIGSTCTEDVNGVMTGVSGARRVSDIKVGDEPIDPDKKYKVAGNDFMITNRGNGLTAFDGCDVVAADAGLDNQLLIDYIVESLGGTVGDDYADPHGQGRIVINE